MSFQFYFFVIPAKAGIQDQSSNPISNTLDSRFRGNDTSDRWSNTINRGNDNINRNDITCINILVTIC